MSLLYNIIYIQITVFIYFSFIFEYWIFILEYRQALQAHFKALSLPFPWSGLSPWAILLASACLSHIIVKEQGRSTCAWVCNCLCVCVYQKERGKEVWLESPAQHFIGSSHPVLKDNSIESQNHQMIDSSRLEKAFKITKFNCCPSTGKSITKPCP